MPACSTAPSIASRVGVFLGAGTADLLRNEDFYRDLDHRRASHRARPSDVWNHFPSTPVDVIAAQFGFEGPRGCVVAACSSSTIAIGRAAEAIRAGRADAALAGGTDALSRLTFSGFNLLRLMDPAPCRPFDRSRAGMNIGEGAGILVLEDLDRARRRGAHDLRGAGRPRPGLRGVPPDGAGAGRPAGRGDRALALRDAAINADEVDHINAHGTATPQNDAAEARGFRRVFGDRTGAAAGDVDQIDDRPLPRRGRRGRGGGAGADRRARRHPADDPPRRDRRRLRRRRRRERGARAARACAVSTSLASAATTRLVRCIGAERSAIASSGMDG